MSARFYVQKAKADANGLRQRLHRLGYTSKLDEATDVDLVARAYLGCDVVSMSRLSDRHALKYLNKTYGIDISREIPDDTPLAGGLYITGDGLYRWIFLEEDDIPTRRRFTLAHELGHLYLEAEPVLNQSSEGAASVFGGEVDTTVLRYGRCPLVALTANTGAPNPETPSERETRTDQRERHEPEDASNRVSAPWQQQQLREIRANHFAAELLLPYDGVRRVLATHVGPAGVRTTAELLTLSGRLADIYQVSGEAARLRLTKDLGIVPLSSDPNSDLFA
jgi:Zn-dependent peptidase ImmA (M78 family)